jgi:phosphoribosyl 1,2-cyclic phosphate phosphodiesterase
MKVTFLGTGTSSGIPLLACECPVCHSDDWRDKRLRCSVFVEVDGLNLLIDAGTDFRQQMLRENIRKIDAVLITHGHKDHTGGIDDIRAYNFSSGKDMPVYVDRYAEQTLRTHYDYVFAKDKYPGIPQLALHHIDKDDFYIENLKITPIQVMHHQLPVTCFRIKDFTYITDAKTISDQEKEKIKGTRILVVNALREKPHISHFNLEEAMQLVDEIQPEHTYFIHISHNFGKHRHIQSKLPMNVSVAYDGLKLTL